MTDRVRPSPRVGTALHGSRKRAIAHASVGFGLMGKQPHSFSAGDRVLVHGGYDGDDSDWLRDGGGYSGTIRKVTANAAAVELDEELELPARSGRNWQEFGRGSASAVVEAETARGRWLTLMHGWVGQTWSDPVRLQVGLCDEEPDLDAIPLGGGIGYWVESHAGIALLGHDAPS